MTENRADKQEYGFTTGIRYGCGFAGGIFLVLLFIGLIFYKFSFVNTYLLSSGDLTFVEAWHIESLLATNRIVAAEDVVAHITTFYSTVITILVGLMGLVGIVGYLHLKHLTFEKLAEHESKVLGVSQKAASQDVQNYLNSKKFSDIISAHVDESLEGTNIDVLNNKMADLENKIEELENRGGVIPRVVSSKLEVLGGNVDGNN